MSATHDIVFLLDCDNTLLGNDRVQVDLSDQLEQQFDISSRKRYWDIFETLRIETGYADYLGALKRFRLAFVSDTRLLRMSSYLLDYPFQDRLYSGAMAAISHCRAWGPTVILSDGDGAAHPPAELSIESIDEIRRFDLPNRRAASRHARS